MEFIIGFLVGGVLTALWRPPKPPALGSVITAEAEAEAFRAIQNYSAETAYAMGGEPL